jgi:hypothetical protein
MGREVTLQHVLVLIFIFIFFFARNVLVLIGVIVNGILQKIIPGRMTGEDPVYLTSRGTTKILLSSIL